MLAKHWVALLAPALVLGCSTSPPAGQGSPADGPGALRDGTHFASPPSPPSPPSPSPPPGNDGDACTTPGDCGSGNCVDSVCCDLPCTDACMACSAAKKVSGVDGACGPKPTGATCGVSSCVADAETTQTCDNSGVCVLGAPSSCGAYACNPGATSCLTTCSTPADCNAPLTCISQACVSGLTNGTTCGGATDCDSGNCVDGVCCDGPCDGSCEACNQSGSLGQCTSIPGGCGTGGTGGTGGAAGTGGSGGNAGTAGSGGTAGISGASGSSGASGASGSGGTGTGVNGVTCADAGDCASGHCADGACCNSACTGQCESCAAAASIGTCTPVTGDPQSGHAPCAGTGVCAGTCDGVKASACSFPTIKCDASTCEGKTLTAPSYCDGEGACKAPSTTTSCSPYVCSSVLPACRTACSSSPDCDSGALCIDNECVDTSTGGTAGASGSGGSSGTAGSAASGLAAEPSDSDCSVSRPGSTRSTSSRASFALLVLAAFGWLGGARRRQTRRTSDRVTSPGPDHVNGCSSSEHGVSRGGL